MARPRLVSLYVLISAVALLIAAVVFGFGRSGERPSVAKSESATRRPEPVALTTSPAAPTAARTVGAIQAAATAAAPAGAGDAPAPRVPDTTPGARIAALEQALATHTDPGQRRALLAAFKRDILAAPEAAAAASLSEFLASGRDVDTGLPFIVGADGMMDSVPSLRTAVLDLLPATNLPLAAEAARTVLHQRRSPAEYALGLRNLAWNDFDGDQRDELAARFNDLVNLHAWRHDPDNAYLEAFDIAVALADSSAFATLASLVDGAASSPAAVALSRAALVALDRLVVRDPGLLVDAYRNDAGYLADATVQRASLLSRLDLGVAEQRAVLVDYLSRSDHGAGELAYFAELYPNANVIHGDWLVTSEDPTLSIDERRERDRTTVVAIDAVLATAPNEATHAVLTQVRERLHAFEVDATLVTAPLVEGPPPRYEAPPLLPSPR